MRGKLAAERSHRCAPSARWKVPAIAHHKLVLVVDDDAAFRGVVQRLLETATSGPYAVDSAADGQEALEKIAAHQPDLVLLDLMMPNVDGWEVLERIRAMDRRPPVIVLSAHLDHHKRAQEAGAAAVLSKPVGLKVLLLTCERLLSLPSTLGGVP